MNTLKRNSNAMFLYNSKETLAEAAYFITSWETDASNKVYIPVNSAYTYDYSIDWGDGNKEQITVNTNPEHEYVNSGIYDIKIYGQFPHFYINSNSTIGSKLRDVKQWGYIKWESFHRSFMGSFSTETLVSVIDSPDLSLVTDFQFAFYGMKANFTSINWDIPIATSLSSLFQSCSNLNCDITINAPLVEDCSNMFSGNYYSEGLITVNTTSALTNVSNMFYYHTKRTVLPVVSNMSNVTNSKYFMKNNFKFNSSINDLVDVMGLKTLEGILLGCKEFNQPISFTSNIVTNMKEMLHTCKKFNSQITADTSNVVNMASLFRECIIFNQEIIMDTSSVTDMSNMFNRTSVFNNGGQPFSFNTSNVSDFEGMLTYSSEFNQDISNLDFSKATNIEQFLQGSASYNNAGLPITMNLDIIYGGYSGTVQAFSGCNSLNQTITLTGCNNLNGLPHFVAGCAIFNSQINIENTSKIYNMSYMFYNTTAFNQDISSWGWDYSKVIYYSSILSGTALDTTNYSKLLIELDAQTVKPNISFRPGNTLTYNSTAEVARQSLIDNDSWTITDGGLV